MPKRTCTINGCQSERVARSLCSKHYQRLRAHGDPKGGNRKYLNPQDSFNARTEWQGRCLVWVGAKDRGGYGTIRINGESVGTHRYAWEFNRGHIPTGMQIDHTCHNRACVNVDHLRLVTQDRNKQHLSGPQRNSASGFRNVHRRGNKWIVSVRRNDKYHHFGTFDTVEEAAPVAERARKKLFREYAGRG